MKDLGLISGASFARDTYLFVRESITLAFYKSSDFCHSVPVHVFVLVLSYILAARAYQSQNSWEIQKKKI